MRRLLGGIGVAVVVAAVCVGVLSAQSRIGFTGDPIWSPWAIQPGWTVTTAVEHRGVWHTFQYESFTGTFEHCQRAVVDHGSGPYWIDPIPSLACRQVMVSPGWDELEASSRHDGTAVDLYFYDLESGQAGVWVFPVRY